MRYHARVVPYGTVDTHKLAQRIHSRCTVTPADVKAVQTMMGHADPATTQMYAAYAGLCGTDPEAHHRR